MLKKTQYTTILTFIYMLGIFSFFKECEIFMSFIVLILSSFLFWKKYTTKIFTISMVIVFIFGIAYADFKIKTDDLLKSIAPINATLTGQVITIPTTTYNDRTKFFINVTNVDTGYDKYKTNSKTFTTINDTKENYNKIKIGDIITVKASLRIPQDSTNPSQFSYSNYLKNFNTFTTTYVTSKNWEIISPPKSLKWKFVQNLNILRQNIIQKHAKIIKSPNIEILGGIVFGDDAISPPEDIKDSFIHSGLMHILAASGLNVAIIFGIWFFIFSKLRISYRLGITTGIFLILFYTLMTGLGPPVLRAALMLVFGLIGKLINRDADNIALLFLVATIILIYNPAYLFDVGFQLSFVVTLGLLIFCPIFAELTKKIPQSIAGAIYIPLIAQIIVAPIQMYYFNTFAVYSLFANILSLPFVSIISFLGFTSSILAMIPRFPNAIITLFDIIMQPVLSILVQISKYFANLPNSLLTIPQCKPFQILLYYILILLIYLYYKKGTGKKLTTCFCLILSILLLSTIHYPNNNLEAIFFNVGNADAILVKTPDNKYSLIDTSHAPYKGGFSQAKAIIYEYLKDNGIKQLEYMIITHYDTDHAGGACDLLNLIRINNIILNPNTKSSKLAQEIIHTAKNKNVNIIYATNKMEYPCQNCKMQTFQHNEKNENNSSVITLFQKGEKDILFTGDAEISVMDNYNLPKQIDVLKVGHHGADKTTSEKFLKEKNIQSAILLTGPNAYGHPTPETLYNLQKANTKILRTDTDNAIKVAITDKSINYYTYYPKNQRWKKI